MNQKFVYSYNDGGEMKFREIEIKDYNEIIDKHKNYDIIGFQYTIISDIEGVKNNQNHVNAKIINFNNVPEFHICDADGEILKGIKHAINACKKFIDDCERLKLI